MTERFARRTERKPETIYDDAALSAREESTAIRMPDDFERLVHGGRGIRLIEQAVERGEERHTIELDPGRYVMSYGFPQADVNDEQFMYRNNPAGRWSTPLRLERDSSAFKRLREELEIRTHRARTAGDVLYTLMSVIDENITSDDVGEDVASSTDIIRNRKSSCVGKSLIAAMLLRETFPEFRVQYVGGSHEQTEHGELRPGEYGHVWLRAELPDERAAFLYDPAFHRLESYDMDDSRERVHPDDPFGSYDVYVPPDQGVIINAAARRVNVGGYKLIEVPRNDEQMTMLMPAVPSEAALHAQVAGKTMLALEPSEPFLLHFVDRGAVSGSGGGHVPGAARVHYPLRNIIRL